MAKAKTPAQGKAHGAEADSAEQITVAGTPTPEAEARPPAAEQPEAVASADLEPDVVPDEMPEHEKDELYNRLVEFLAHFDRATKDELSKISAARLEALQDIASHVRSALAERRMEDAVQLAEKLGHSISAALVPDFDAEIEAEGADDEANAAPVEQTYRVTRDGSFIQNGFPTTIRKGSVISSSKYNMSDVHAAVKKGRLHIEAI